MVHEIYRMGHKDTSFVVQFGHYYILDNLLAHMSVEGWNRVIKQVDVFIGVNSPSKTYSGFLAAWQINALFSDLCEISTLKYLEGRAQSC